MSYLAQTISILTSAHRQPRLLTALATDDALVMPPSRNPIATCVASDGGAVGRLYTHKPDASLPACSIAVLASYENVP
jgi:hypothetical protein